ncbi:hypothetical protein ACLOJK_032968 [Asimina triloba]
MDTERRKRQVPNGDNGRRAKARGDEVAKAASEEDVDVEEFFAILRRMHAVARYLGDRKGGNGRELTDGGRRWRPVFELEDFEGGGNGVKSRGEEKGKSEAAAAAAEEEGEKKEREDEKRATREWDLNAEPEPENAAAHSS